MKAVATVGVLVLLSLAPPAVVVWAQPPQPSGAYNFAFLGFNTKASPFSNPDARRAVMTGLDRNKAAGDYVTATGIIPPGCIGYNRAARMPIPSLQTANDLLARANVRTAGLTNITLWLYRGAHPLVENVFVGGFVKRDAQDAVVGTLLALGMRVDVKEFTEPEELRRTIPTPAVHMYLLSMLLSDACRRSTPLELLAHSNGLANFSGYSSSDLDGLIDRAGASTDPGTRTRLYAEAEQRVIDEAVLIPIGWGNLPPRTYRPDAQVTDHGLTVRVTEVSLRGATSEVGKDSRISLTIQNGTGDLANLFAMLVDTELVDEWENTERVQFFGSTFPDRIPGHESATGVLLFKRGRQSTRKLLLSLPGIRVGGQEVSFRIDISPP